MVLAKAQRSQAQDEQSSTWVWHEGILEIMLGRKFQARLGKTVYTSLSPGLPLNAGGRCCRVLCWVVLGKNDLAAITWRKESKEMGEGQ